MFPIRDDNPTVHASLTTFLLIGVNVAVWIWVQGLGMAPNLTASVFRYGLIPGELLGRLPAGGRIALGPELIYVVGGPDMRTLVTSMFLHGGWLHLIGNLWFLAIFGDNVEDAMGPVRFAAFYLLCGLAAAVAQIVSNPSSPIPMVGASGAIGGVMAAYVRLYPRAPVHVLVFLGIFITRIVVPAFLMLGYWFLLQILGGLTDTGNVGGGTAFWAHVGGFAAGLALVYPFCNPRRLARSRRKRFRT
jgi:membrane associated rhomboid family serine protease